MEYRSPGRQLAELETFLEEWPLYRKLKLTGEGAVMMSREGGFIPISPVRLSTSSLFVLPSPVNGRVGIRDFTFEACSSFTHVAACQIACPPIADVCPEAPTQPVTRPSRSVATMLIDIYMDGFSLHW